MRWSPPHPREALVVIGASLLLALLLVLAAAPDLATMDFSIRSDTGGSPAAGPVVADDPAREAPAWVRDPLASPLTALDGGLAPPRP